MKLITTNILTLLIFFNAHSQNNMSVQQRLNNNESPFSIYQSNHALLDSLYTKNYGGGKIAGLDTTTGNVLVYANEDIGFYPWGCEHVPLKDANKDGYIGAGIANTASILATCTQRGDIAAALCDTFSASGYKDWYLPSKYELILIRNNVFSRNPDGFHHTNNGYWSSNSEITGSQNNSWTVGFGGDINETNGGYQRDYQQYVRAVRMVDTIQQKLDAGFTPFQVYLENPSLLQKLYGKRYQGGIIAYLNTQNGSGLIIAENDIQPSSWGCGRNGTDYNGKGVGRAIGTGATNTSQVARICGGGSQSECEKLVLNGYSDWFLPSIDELKAIYSNKVGGMNGLYWSSSHSDVSQGIASGVYLNFNDGNEYSQPMEGPREKLVIHNVRPARYIPIATLAPVTTSNAVTNIMFSSVTVGGSVTSDGGALVTKKGICYSLSPNPTIADSVALADTAQVPGDFTVNITNLINVKKYYFRAFATNALGTSYGEIDTFRTDLGPIWYYPPQVRADTNKINFSITVGITKRPYISWAHVDSIYIYCDTIKGSDANAWKTEKVETKPNPYTRVFYRYQVNNLKPSTTYYYRFKVFILVDGRRDRVILGEGSTTTKPAAESDK